MNQTARVFLVAVIGVLSLPACVSTQESSIAQPAPKFGWEPPGKEPSQKLTVAFVAPKFGADAKLGSYKANKYLKMFLDALQTDLERTLIAKGFTVTKTYANLDEMTFPEKKAAPLALLPEVDLILNETYQENRTRKVGSGQSIEKRGTVTASAVVRFAILEPLSGQKMWLKKVEIPQETARIEVDLLVDSHGNLNKFSANKDNRDAAVVDVLNKAYPVIMGKFWNYLNSEEIGIMKKAADEARARKVF